MQTKKSKTVLRTCSAAFGVVSFCYGHNGGNMIYLKAMKRNIFFVAALFLVSQAVFAQSTPFSAE